MDKTLEFLQMAMPNTKTNEADVLIKTLTQTRTGVTSNYVDCDVKPIYIQPEDKLSI